MTAEKIFNEDRLRQHRQRHQIASHYLSDELCQNLMQRLQDLQLEFASKRVLLLGLTKPLQELVADAAVDEVSLLAFQETHSLSALEEGSYDVVIDCFVQHWLNDPVAHMKDVFEKLKSGGVYLSAFPGGYTLKELRFALVEADLEVYGGACPRVSPMITPEATTRILQVCGFKDPVVDHDNLMIEHRSLASGVAELRSFSETACFMDAQKVKPLRKRHLELLKTALEDQKTGKVSSTFDVVYALAHKE